MKEETKNELVQVVEESGLEKETSTTLKDKFLPFFEQAQEWKAKAEALKVTDVSQVTEMQEARKARLALRDIRIEADKTRKLLKEDSLRYERAVQGVYNVIEYLIAPIEQHLQEQEDFAKVQEEKRLKALVEERTALLSPYVSDPSIYPLGQLSDQAFNDLLEGQKLQLKAHQDAEIKAEEERIAKEKAEAEERERIRQENERLRAEYERREKEIAEQRKKDEKEREKERQRVEVERKQLEEKARKEREQQEAILKKEREERERAEAELRAKQEAEAEAKRKEEERIQSELSKGDKEKFESMMTELSALKTKYAFKSKKYQTLQSQVNDLIDKIIVYVSK